MDPKTWARLRGLIEDALDEPADARQDYLQRACGDDVDLLKEAAELLRYNQGDGDDDDGLGLRKETSAIPEARTADAWDAFLVQLGSRGRNHERYATEAEIGRGGMGVVKKVQDRDLRRTLAMKVIRSEDVGTEPGRSALDSVALGRFLEEAQVTSQLDHPGIVPVHELGIDDEGHVYFTMKLVKGIELREVLDHVKTGTDGWSSTRVLHVILRACEAVAYAHAKGVIHRDLKPSNIMVGRYGETYVMDWGLARVLGRDDPHQPPRRRRPSQSVTIIGTDRADLREHDTGSALGTMDGDVIGTPIYMAPEQASGRQVEIGPASDVYAMGAILYQLLTNSLPYIPPGAEPTPHTVLRWVMEGPPRPVAELNPAVPPELIAICEKAMHRDPGARYQAMGEFADDLRAYIERRVVKAYQTGPLAELKKWVSRNRWAATSIAAGVLLAISAGFFTAWQQRKHAEIVAHERDAARAIADFQREVLTIDPWEIGPDATPLDVVHRAAARARVAFEGRSDIEASILLAVGDTYFSFGAYPEAAEQYEASLETRLKVLAPDDPEIAGARRALATAYLELGRLRDAAELHREILASRRARFGERHPETLASKLDLAKVESELLKYDEAAALQREVVQARAEALGAEHAETLTAKKELARTLLRQNRDEEADRSFREILAVDGIPEKLALECRAGTALVHSQAKRYEEAAEIERAVFESYRTRLGDLHPDTLEARDQLASELFGLKRYEEVLEMDRQILARRRQVLGESHPDTFLSISNEAYDLASLDRIEEGVAMARAAADGCRAAHGIAHPSTITVTLYLARILRLAGEFDEATALARQLVDVRRERLGEEHPETLDLVDELARFLEYQDKEAESEPLWRRILEVRRAELGPSHSETLSALLKLANCLSVLGRYEEVLPLDAERLARLTERHGEDHPQTIAALASLASTEKHLERYESAEARLRRVLAYYAEHEGGDSAKALEARRDLASVLGAAGSDEEAARLYAELLPAFEERFGPEASETNKLAVQYGITCNRLGRYAELEALDRRVYEYGLRTRGASDTETLQAKLNIASTLRKLERYDEAEGLLRELLDVESEEHASKAHGALFGLLEDQARYHESIPMRRALLAELRAEKGDRDPATRSAISNLSAALAEVGEWEESAELDRESLEGLLENPERSPTSVVAARYYLATSLRHSKSLEEAEAVIRAALTVGREALGERHPQTVRARYAFALIRAERGDEAEAERELRELVALPRQQDDRLGSLIASSRGRLAQRLVVQGRAEEAVALFSETSEDELSKRPSLTLRYGEALTAVGRHDEAEARLLAAEEANPVSELRMRRAIREALVRLYEAWDRPDDAARYRALRED